MAVYGQTSPLTFGGQEVMLNDNFFSWMSYYSEDWFPPTFVFPLLLSLCTGRHGYRSRLLVPKELKRDGLVRV